MTDKSLKELRDRIEEEAAFVDIKTYSHNIISLALNSIHDEFGFEEANRAIDDFGLEALGWRKLD